jgi:hypothetical protein
MTAHRTASRVDFLHREKETTVAKKQTPKAAAPKPEAARTVDLSNVRLIAEFARKVGGLDKAQTLVEQVEELLRACGGAAAVREGIAAVLEVQSVLEACKDQPAAEPAPELQS